MRFRLWHLMLLVLVSALAVTGYRLWPRPKPKLRITIIKKGSLAWPPPGGRRWTAPLPRPALGW